MDTNSASEHEIESPFSDSWVVAAAIARHPLSGIVTEYARLGAHAR